LLGGNARKKSIKQLMPKEWQASPISTYQAIEWERESENQQPSNPVRKYKQDDDVFDDDGWRLGG